MSFSSDSLAGLHFKRPHPDVTQPDIKMVLLDESWASADTMAKVIDITFAAPNGIIRNYQASKVKKIGKFPIGALASVGGLFGKVKFKPATAATGFFQSRDPLAVSDPVIQNALTESLFTSGGAPVPGPHYGVPGHILRTWIFQEKSTAGQWQLTSTNAVWSVGSWNKIDEQFFKSGAHPLPAVFEEENLSANSLVDFPDFTTWQAIATFQSIFLTLQNLIITPASAQVDAFFPGPVGGFAGIPTDGQTYTSVGTLILHATVTNVFGPFTFDCGTVTWTITWTFHDLP